MGDDSRDPQRSASLTPMGLTESQAFFQESRGPQKRVQPDALNSTEPQPKLSSPPSLPPSRFLMGGVVLDCRSWPYTLVDVKTSELALRLCIVVVKLCLGLWLGALSPACYDRE